MTIYDILSLVEVIYGWLSQQDDKIVFGYLYVWFYGDANCIVIVGKEVKQQKMVKSIIKSSFNLSEGQWMVMVS